MLRSACVRLRGFLSAGRPFSSGCVPASDEEGVYYSPHGTIDIPNDRSFSHFLLEHAEQFGDKGSFEHARSLRGYSYSSLVQNAHSFASALQRLGLKNVKGERVCLHAPNIPEYPQLFHGVGVAAGVSSTASPQFTAHELAVQLDDSSAKFLVTTTSLVETAVQAAGMHDLPPERVIVVDDVQDFSAEELAERGEGWQERVAAAAADTIAYEKMLGSGERLKEAPIDARREVATLPYSSGTTGKPKGVMLVTCEQTHYNLLSNLLQIDYTEPLTINDNLIAVLPFFHIYPLMLLMSNSLYRGCGVSCLPRFDLELFLKTLQDKRVSRAHIAPPIAVALAKHPLVDQFDLSNLKIIFSGAAPLSQQLEAQVVERLGVRVKQAYGMTEMSPASHVAIDDRLQSGSVGPLVPNCKAKIIDSDGNRLGRNKVGEICVHGPQVMLGYLGREDATAETIDEEGYIHTGDTGYIDERDHFYIVDRVKELIKYKGHQVPPAELEAELLQHPAVADAAVIGIPDEVAGELPKAYVVLKPGVAEDMDSVMRTVNEHLAPYKRIRAMEGIDQIPKSASGKILRRILRDHK